MARRAPIARTPLRPEDQGHAVSRVLDAPARRHPTYDTTCAPPPAEWPRSLKRLLAARLAAWGTTFDAYARPYHRNGDAAGRDAAMWDLLRMAARDIRGVWRVVTNAEAWTICTTTATALAENEGAEPAGATAA